MGCIINEEMSTGDLEDLPPPIGCDFSRPLGEQEEDILL